MSKTCWTPGTFTSQEDEKDFWKVFKTSKIIMKMHLFVEILEIRKVWNVNQNLRIGVINGQISPTQYVATGFIVKFRAWRRLVFNRHWSVQDDAKTYLILSSLKDKEERKMTVVLVFVVRWRRWHFMFPRFIYHHFWDYEIEFYMFSYSLFFTQFSIPIFGPEWSYVNVKNKKTESSLCHTQGGCYSDVRAWGGNRHAQRPWTSGRSLSCTIRATVNTKEKWCKQQPSFSQCVVDLEPPRDEEDH